jgi:hypothetical protein
LNESFEPDLIKTIFLIIRSLLQKGIFSPHPENVAIERVGRGPVYPCGRYGSEGLDLSQLEWAMREGRFWFLGPFRDLKIIIDKGLLQGDLIGNWQNDIHYFF